MLLNTKLWGCISVNTSVTRKCPPPPLLFALYLEPHYQSTIRSLSVKVDALRGAEVKVLAYADDIAYICGDKPRVNHALELTHTFCAATAAAVNLHKCRGFWHGCWATTSFKYENIK